MLRLFYNNGCWSWKRERSRADFESSKSQLFIQVNPSPEAKLVFGRNPLGLECSWVFVPGYASVTRLNHQDAFRNILNFMAISVSLMETPCLSILAKEKICFLLYCEALPTSSSMKFSNHELEGSLHFNCLLTSSNSIRNLLFFTLYTWIGLVTKALLRLLRAYLPFTVICLNRMFADLWPRWLYYHIFVR